MNYVTHEVQLCPASMYWSVLHYNVFWVPTFYMDGGHYTVPGPNSQGIVRTLIEDIGERYVPRLSLEIAVEWLGDATIGINVRLAKGWICVDSDADGYGDPDQAENECQDDNCPEVYNFLQEDTDDDGLGDACDPDIDADGLLNDSDNCPFVHNPMQENSDTDSHGDSCDNCIYDENEYQYDEDHDGNGDACDEFKLYIQCCLDIPGAYLNEPFSYQFWAIGGEPPYVWEKLYGQFPYGLAMNDEGLLQGIPTHIATSNVRLVVEDQYGSTDSAWIEIIVVESTQNESLCGDADGSEEIDIDDVVYLINYIFAGGPEPAPYEAGDADCSSGVDIDDAVYLISYIFSSGNEPCDIDGDEVPDC